LPGLTEYTAENATVEHEAGTAGTRPYFVREGEVSGSGGDAQTFSYGPVSEGDLILALVKTVGAPGPTWNGWNLIDSWATENVTHTALVWRIVQVGESGTYTLPSVSTDFWDVWYFVYRAVDTTTPLIFGGSQSGSGGNPTATAVTVVRNNSLAWFLANQTTGTYPSLTEPTGYTLFHRGNWYGPTLMATKAVEAGVEGAAEAASTGSGAWRVNRIVLQPIGTDGGDYYSWFDMATSPQGIAYDKDPLAGSEDWSQGGPYDGLHIEARFPTTVGGTLAPSTIQIDVWDAADGNHHSETFTGLIPPIIYSWLCNYVTDPIAGTWPDGAPPDPWAAVGATLADIAAALTELKKAMSMSLGYLVNINTLVAEIYGPWAGTIGQAQEYVEGGLGQFVRDSLVAMSNYSVGSQLETLVDSGVTGDWACDDVGAPYRVSITSDLSNKARHASVPINYAVWRSGPQLGWVTWITGSGYLDSQPLHWQNTYIRCPSPIATGFIVHLQPGVTGDIYREEDVYTPRLS